MGDPYSSYQLMTTLWINSDEMMMAFPIIRMVELIKEIIKKNESELLDQLTAAQAAENEKELGVLDKESSPDEENDDEEDLSDTEKVTAVGNDDNDSS